MAAVVVGLAKGYTHVLAPATSNGKNVTPRVAALLDMQQISEIISVESPDTFVRPIYAGNALATVQSADAIKVITVRTTGFDAVAATGGTGTVESVSAPPTPACPPSSAAKCRSPSVPNSPPRRSSSPAGAAWARARTSRSWSRWPTSWAPRWAPRARAVDAGFVPNDWQVGQTGKIVAPDLYIAIGISGAIQHLAGMKDSRVIVCINKDEEAPIFSVADYGIVGDLFQVVPQLVDELNK